MSMEPQQEQRPPDSDAPGGVPETPQAPESAPPNAAINELTTPPPLLDMTEFTDEQVRLVVANISMVGGVMTSFKEALAETVIKPLGTLLEGAPEQELSWQQGFVIFQARRALRDAVIELAQNLRPWTHQDHPPLFRQYISVVEKLTEPLFNYDTGTLRRIELSEGPSWRLHLREALVNIEEALLITEEGLGWFAQGAEEVKEELGKRGLSAHDS